MASPRSKLSAAWAVESAAQEGKYRKKAKASLANLVQVSIRQNCPELTHYKTDHLVVGGLTLRERVTRDKEQKEKDPKSIVMGKAYWEKLRRDYTSDSNELKSLGAVDMDKVSPKLFEAISKTRLRCPDRRALTEFATRTHSVRKDEAVAMMKVMCTMDPSKHADQRECLCECLSLLSRSSLESCCTEQLQTMSKRFDSIALQVLNEKNPDTLLSNVRLRKDKELIPIFVIPECGGF
eukprot:6490979-Amphidinium_carterae.2